MDIVLSEYPDKSHNCRNFIFMTSHFSTKLLYHTESTWTFKQSLKGQQSVWVLMLCSQQGMGHSLVSIDLRFRAFVNKDSCNFQVPAPNPALQAGKIICIHLNKLC